MLLDARQCGDIGRVIDSIDIESVCGEKIVAVTFEIAYFCKVLLRDGCHALVHFGLDFRI